jgi:tetratricopeptide (TPR) repeat protein
VKLLTIFLTIALTLASASADESPAKRFFLSGQKHFDLGEYADALHDFKEAYRVHEDPVFIYNIAQCQRLLGQNVDAIRSYKSYLRRSPEAPNRSEVEHKITALEELPVQTTPAVTTPVTPIVTTPVPTTPTTTEPATVTVVAAAPPHERQPVYKKWWLWTAVGAAVVVGVGVGLGVGLSRSSTPQFPAVSF